MKKLIFILLASVTVFSCKKNNTVNNVVNDPTQGTVTCKIDGVDVNLAAGQNGVLSTSQPIKMPNGNTTEVSYIESIFNSATPAKNKFNFLFGTIIVQGGTVPDANQFRALFANGDRQFIPLGTNGVQVEYYDADGKLWTTATGSQSGNGFRILDYQEIPGSYITAHFRGQFACTLYSSDGKSSKALTAGNFTGGFANQ